MSAADITQMAHNRIDDDKWHGLLMKAFAIYYTSFDEVSGTRAARVTCSTVWQPVWDDIRQLPHQ